MQWTVHGRRTIYDSPWISLDLVDVEQPDGKRYEQHVARMAPPRPLRERPKKKPAGGQDRCSC